MPSLAPVPVRKRHPESRKARGRREFVTSAGAAASSTAANLSLTNPCNAARPALSSGPAHTTRQLSSLRTSAPMIDSVLFPLADAPLRRFVSVQSHANPFAISENRLAGRACSPAVNGHSKVNSSDIREDQAPTLANTPLGFLIASCTGTW